MRKWVLSMTLMMASLGFAGGLQEKDVLQLMAKVDEAINARDAGGGVAQMGDDVEIIMHMTVQGQKTVMRPSRDEYQAMIAMSWQQYSEYDYQRDNVMISLEDDKAEVSATITETIGYQGQSMTGHSKEVATVEMVEGAPKITRVVGHTSM
ncbi:MAG: hypothetical protein R3330_10670 [Saprospiraceae bacterium]|nr:hypothetical protein [Saprospiraceae bacterium]